jgi:type IX secretion system PorP/SprF family membrane protein
MKKTLTACLLLIASFSYAQQDPQISQYMYNRLGFNAGYAGANGSICATLIGRQQWVGFDGAPKTNVLSIDAPVKKLHGGLGLTIATDKLGFENNFFGKLAYAFRLPIGDDGNLGIGVEAGMYNKSINGDWKATDDVSADKAIPVGKAADNTFDLGFGIHYHTPKFYVGLSSTHLNQGKIQKDKLNFEIARHYFVTAGYNYDINETFTLRPSVLVKSVGSATTLDANVNVLYNNLLWLGVSYRTSDAIVPMVGFQKAFNAKSAFKVGYAYDVTTSKLKTQSNGSHELMLGFCYTIIPKTTVTKYKNVRFL